jgi:hypothetical protein
MRGSKPRRRSRGAVLVEYAFLLTAFAIPACMGILLAGAKLAKEYQDARSELLRPMP